MAYQIGATAIGVCVTAALAGKGSRTRALLGWLPARPVRQVRVRHHFHGAAVRYLIPEEIGHGLVVERTGTFRPNGMAISPLAVRSTAWQRDPADDQFEHGSRRHGTETAALEVLPLTYSLQLD